MIDNHTAQLLAQGLESGANKLEKVITVYQLNNGSTDTVTNRIMALVMLREFADMQIATLTQYTAPETAAILDKLAKDFVRENVVSIMKISKDGTQL